MFALLPLLYIIIIYLSHHEKHLSKVVSTDASAADSNTTSLGGGGGGGLLFRFSANNNAAVLPFDIGFDSTINICSSNSSIGTDNDDDDDEKDGDSPTSAVLVGKQFILCPYNQHNAENGVIMYRSPWSNNSYFSSPSTKNETKRKENKGVDVVQHSSHGSNSNSNSDTNNNKLRSLEIYANEMFDIYRTLYYCSSNSVCSVYLWDNHDDRSRNDGSNVDDIIAVEEQILKESKESRSILFGGCILIQNQMIDHHNDDIGDDDACSRIDEDVTAYWNSIHEITVSLTNKADMGDNVTMEKNSQSMKRMSNSKNNNATYEITSTILLSVTTTSTSPTAAHATSGVRTTRTMTNSNDVCGSLTRHTVRECNYHGDIYDYSHIHNIGKYVEEVESRMRSELDALYLSRLQTTVGELVMGKEEKYPLDVDGRGPATRHERGEVGSDYTKALNEALLARAQRIKTFPNDLQN